MSNFAMRAWTALFLISASMPAVSQDVRRGEYVARAAGCVGCHTEAKPGATPFAGGRALATPFGTFFGPNITPHPDAGIGKWSEEDLKRAVRLGERPDGAHYYPAFPYTSFTGMSDGDIRDLWAYLRSLPPSERRNTPHDLSFPFNLRFTVAAWKWLFFTPGASVAGSTAGPVARGAYIANSLAHCGECHTPRNFLGAMKRDQLLAGGEVDGKVAPNLTPTRLKKWGDAELKDVLATGQTPDGDMVSTTMNEVVTNTLSKLTPEDLSALVAYLRSVPPQPEKPRK